MSDPKKPKRLSDTDLETIRGNIQRCGDASEWEQRAIFDHIAALTAELEERTRERDEAVEHLRNVVDACEQHADEIGPYGECAGKIWTAELAEEWLDKKGPADDR